MPERHDPFGIAHVCDQPLVLLFLAQRLKFAIEGASPAVEDLCLAEAFKCMRVDGRSLQQAPLTNQDLRLVRDLIAHRLVRYPWMGEDSLSSLFRDVRARGHPIEFSLDMDIHPTLVRLAARLGGILENGGYMKGRHLENFRGALAHCIPEAIDIVIAEGDAADTDLLRKLQSAMKARRADHPPTTSGGRVRYMAM